jgi:hypothetical protein
MPNLYWPNGQLKRSVEFQDGIRSGFDRMWSEEGVLVDEGFYQNGLPTGTHKRWNKKGNLIEEITYLDANRRNYRHWDDEGILRTEGIWNGNEYQEKAWDRFQKVWVGKSENLPHMILETSIPQGTWEDGFAILMERFPHLGMQYLTLDKKPSQFEFLKPFDVGRAEAVIVFGLRMGAPYFQLKDWLHAKANRKLVFIDENFASFIAHSPHVSLLKDPQVFLENEFLPEKYPLHRVEVVGLPEKKKLSVLREMTLAHALHVDRMHGYQIFSNFIQNRKRFSKSFYANALRNKFGGVPAIVCGAGPSLQKAIPYLKNISGKALIIAGGSTLAALSSQGVPIHFGVAIDPNLEEYRRLKNSFAFQTPLLYSTRVHPDIFQTCSGPFGYMRSGIGGVAEVWMEEELGLLDPLIGENLSPESISVTTICVAFAQYIGCSTICLSGVDLAYTNRKRYAQGVDGDENICFEEIDAEKSVADRILKRKNREGKTIFTAVRWIMEAAALSHYAKKHPEIHWVNTSDGGLPIQGIPYLDLETIDFKEEFDLKKKIADLIATSPMPFNEEKIQQLIDSLDRVIAQLEILAGEKKGSAALTELDLQEELAKDILFYDFGSSSWVEFLNLARKYKSVL